MENEKYCIKWKNRTERLQTAFGEFIDQQILCDVTLVGEGELFKAHQFVLAACSSYFKNILKGVLASQHPIIFLRDVSSQEIKCILEYMYKGETVVPKNMMHIFLKTCESLRIYGLYEEEHSSSQEVTQVFDNERRISNGDFVNSIKRRRNKSDDTNLVRPKQSRLFRKTSSFSNENASTPDHPPSKENNINNDQCLPSLTSTLDLSQVDFPGSNATHKDCPNDNVNVLESPPRSPQSFVFSVRNPDNNNFRDEEVESTLESVVVLPANNNDIIEISDDNTEKSNLHGHDKTTTSDADKLENLDECSDVFELALSPENQENNQDEDTDESEIIAKTKNNTEYTKPNKYKGSDKTSYSPAAKVRAIQRAQGLKVVLTKTPIQVHSSNYRHLPSASKGLSDAPRKRDNNKLEITDQGHQSSVSLSRNLREKTSRHVYVGGVFESIRQVPDNMKTFYCEQCRRCVRPVLWKKHVREHSL